MRLKQISPVLAVAVIASGLGAMMAMPSQAAPVKLYFHSAGGSYAADVAADPLGPTEDAAPAGSTLDPKAPTKTADATATGASTYDFGDLAGSPILPTFTLPFKGDVTGVCIDIWVKANGVPPTFPLITRSLFNTPAAFLDNEDVETAYTTPGAYVRVTKLVKPAAGKATVADASEFIIGGYMDVSVDWTMAYDSVTRPSSITINPADCKAAPVVVPSGSATPSPTGSSSATTSPSGSASATASPSGSETPSATPSGTETPSATPTATPSPTPPPPAQETSLDYTGPSRGRYGDMAIVSARMSLPDGSPVPAGAVEFTLGTVVVRYNVNSNGVATGRLPVRVASGQHVLTARYAANHAYLGAGEQAPFSVSRMPSRCAISRTVSGGRMVVTGTLRDAANRAVVGQSMHFRFNNRTFKAVRTDRNGRASVTVNAARGAYTIALPSNAYYVGCSASFRY